MMRGALVISDPRVSGSGTAGRLARTTALKHLDQETLGLLARSARTVYARGAGQCPGAPAHDQGLLVLLSGHAAVGTPEKVVETEKPETLS